MKASKPATDISVSFRDPSGRLLRASGRILRLINRDGVADLEAFLNSSTFQRLLETKRLVRTTMLDSAAVDNLIRDCEAAELFELDDGWIIAEHEQIPFQSFPYEWPPEMLHEAARLTLDLAESLVAESLGLKDATPYNILFRGPDPVFVDVLSFERRNPNDPIWLPQAQFERTFLLPLLVNKQFRVELSQLLSSRRDGLEPEDVYRLCGPLRKLSPPFLSLASIPTWLGARHDKDDTTIYHSKTLSNPEKARFILESSLKRLRRKLDRLRPRADEKSRWSDYMASDNNYTEQHFRAKQDFIEKALLEFRPASLLDIGCNTGHFSAIAARSGARVVAIDSDEVVVGETWRRARAEHLDVLPLVVNLARPSPAMGWRNRECASFLDRARGAFDAVMMLAVIHHMLVSERIPLEEIIELAAELTNDILMIEFIAPEDSMFRRLARGREHLHEGLTPQLFEAVCKRRFELIRSQHLDETSRWFYLLRKR
ncbi:MAG TPA: methyltransferase domain-containing protein [Blastocatellia bacterium]|nr:methyltransferase domain-containing protein [Blastocatellia bacterium]